MRLVTLALLSWSLFAQNPAAPAAGEEAKKGRIEGKAVHAVTGEPVRKANISLSSPEQGRQGISVVTDNAGAFVFENLTPGHYRMQGEKAGFVRSAYGSRQLFSMGSLLRVTEGGEIKDVVLKITPAGILSGRVVDEDGEPMEGVQVQVLRKVYTGNAMRWSPTGAGASNDRGEFRVGSLAPGRYLVSVQLNRFGPGMGGAPLQQGKEEFSYVRTYFPGVESPEQAEVIHIQPGQEYGGVQVALKKTRVYRIKGKFTGTPSGEGPGQRMSVQIREKNASDMMGGIMFGPGNSVNPKDGTFEIANVRPGSYRVTLLDMEAGRPKTVGAADVVVGSENVEGLVLAPVSAATVTGKLRIEGDPVAGLTPRSFQIQLQPKEMGFPSFVQPAQIQEDGSFKLEGAGPEVYRVMAFGGPGRSYVKAILAGGRDVTESGIDLSAGGAQLEVIVSTKIAKLEGTVEKAKPEAMPGVVVFAKQGTDATFFGPMSAPASVTPAGTFSVAAVSPGEYKAYAFEDVDMMTIRDPDFLKKFDSKAVTLKIGEGESKSVTLKQISNAEIEEASKR